MSFILGLLIINGVFADLEKKPCLNKKNSFNLKMPVFAECVFKHPSRYLPEDLYHAGLYFLEQKIDEKAYPLLAAGLWRIEIEARLSQDYSLSDMTTLIHMNLKMHLMDDLKWDEKKICEFQERLKVASSQFPEWDREHSYRYRLLGPSLSLSLQQRIIDRVYREAKGSFLFQEGDDYKADPSDDAYFDCKNRHYYINRIDEQISFFVPKQAIPLVNKWGKYNLQIWLPDHGELGFNTSFVYSDTTIETQYEFFLSLIKDMNESPGESSIYKEYNHQADIIHLTNNLEAVRFRYISQAHPHPPEVHQEIIIILGNTVYGFHVTSPLEEEQHHFDTLKQMIESIQLIRSR
jgi:hypothetical protein